MLAECLTAEKDPKVYPAGVIITFVKRQKILGYLVSVCIDGKRPDNWDELSKLNFKKPKQNKTNPIESITWTDANTVVHCNHRGMS